MIKVSVVMPVYNGEKYLKESIESILNQTYKNIEFIIVNDGSIDNSGDIINYYANIDKRIKVISRVNKGLVFSLNEAIMHSSGEYIARMDCDDISVNNRIEKQVCFLENNKEIDILGTQVKFIGDLGNPKIKKWDLIINKKYYTDLSLIISMTNPVIHPSVMIRKQFFEIFKYSNKYKTIEDYNLWFEAFLNNKKIANLDEKLIMVRFSDESKTSTDGSNVILKEKCNLKLDHIINNKNLCSKTKFNAYIWGASNGGRMLLENINRRQINIDILGFIDEYKTGKFDNFHIYNKEILKSKNYNYVFVATEPGRFYAYNYLLSLGQKVFEDFIYIL